MSNVLMLLLPGFAVHVCFHVLVAMMLQNQKHIRGVANCTHITAADSLLPAGPALKCMLAHLATCRRH